MSSSTVSSSSNLRSTLPWTHDVFLSFAIANRFTHSIESSLRKVEIRTFVDDGSGGDDDDDEISPALLRAMEGSRIFMIVLTKEYGGSRRCLLRLEKIMEFQRYGKIGEAAAVLPVFYEVNPWEVRKQNGSFGKAFEGVVRKKGVREDEVRWRKALAEISKLTRSGVVEVRNDTILQFDPVAPPTPILNLRTSDNVLVGNIIDCTRRILDGALFVVFIWLKVWSDRGSNDYSLPGDNYPDWLNFKGEGSSILFKVPEVPGSSLKGVILCIIYLSPQESMESIHLVSVLIRNYTKGTIEFYKRDLATASNNDEDWLTIISDLEPNNEVEITVAFSSKFNVKQTLIYLVYGEAIVLKLSSKWEIDEDIALVANIVQGLKFPRSLYENNGLEGNREKENEKLLDI
ncbi:TMV resistance protein N-like [Senna tora]|uniref:TMV resistance protein N-like n=1 Tax=Senna tora TaxID=362788 RepID=A0A834XKX1_9FABA|nr:TMV resistance protein N-like [Senna tora]